MTDHIDLDELTDDDQSDDGDDNDGDWLWRDADGPAPPADAGDDDATDAADSDATDSTGERDTPDGGSTDATGESGTADAGDASDASGTEDDDREDSRVPHVPRPNRDKPVGIPKEGGGAGGAPARDQPSGEGTMTADEDDADTEAAEQDSDGVASGPHGGGVDDMTMAMTYDAATDLATPSAAFADARQWADWVGIVGDVPAHVLNKFQRDNRLDLDFFNGSGMEPAERLADVDEHSMFYAERMVLVGRDGQEGIAERAGWEFVTLTEAAEKADWDLAP